MSTYRAFKRQPVNGQLAQKLQTTTVPAPTRGLVLNENEAYMQPGGALVLDNWKPTMRGIALRGGCVEWCALEETTPVISAFEYVTGAVNKMFAANANKLYDVTFSIPSVVKSGQTSGNYSTAQLSNAAGEFLIAVNDGGDYPLHYDGVAWTTLNSGEIWADDPGSDNVADGANLVYVCKYRNRLFFIEAGSMNAWYLGTDAKQGELKLVPLSGAATRGGNLLFCAVWTIDAGDGIDDKLVFCTTEGELLIFTGSNPADAANWRQEGRYQIPKPMGMNAHVTLGGDLLIATLEGIVPVSSAITKTAEQLELAMITRTIKNMWRAEAIAKRQWPWTMQRWDEYGGMFVTWPGGKPGAKVCAVVNTATTAWTRYVGWDATCFMRLRADMFFGTQDGRIMQADRGGYDDGEAYVATMVGGWEMFGAPSNMLVWHQARASFSSNSNEPFAPQISATTDYIITLPTPPPAGPDPGILDLWDQGLWDQALWDQPGPPPRAPIRNTGWVSVGATGFAHAPVVQISVAQQIRPNVELISIAVTYERVGVNV